MNPTILFKKMPQFLLVTAVFMTISVNAQVEKVSKQTSNNENNLESKIWTSYVNKTNLLLEKVDEISFVNYVILSNDGDFADRKYFVGYVKTKMAEDKKALIYKVGDGTIKNVSEVNAYYSSLHDKYNQFYKDFLLHKSEIIETEEREELKRAPIYGGVVLNCGSPCTNPGFESGTGFWDYWIASACISATSDPCFLTPGYDPFQHVIQTVGGFDPIVGAALPVVPPGGGANSLMLGDGPITGGYASRASISFTVSAANANFTYKYAVVLQDPVSGHTDPERPYFNVRLRDASGNVVPCGDYEVVAKPPIVNFTETSAGSAIWYRNWTTVFVPLTAYIGQCVTIQFTVADCSQGGHYGYAYIDADCDQLQIVSSSPAVCAGSSLILTAPAGGAAYAWTNTAGGTTGIVGSTTGQTATVNQGGTYQVVITSVSGPTCITTLTIVVGTSPANPLASFSNTTVCTGAATAFTDTSTPFGSVNVWSWDFNNDGIEDSNVQNPTYTFPAPGTYPVTLICSWGPCNSTITQNVTVNAGVSPVINSAGPFCITAATLNLTASVAGGTWSGTGITNAILGTFDPASATIGNNTITYSILGACTGTTTSVIVVNPLPIANAGPDFTICSATSGNLGAPLTFGNTYLWTPVTGLSSTSIADPTVTLTNSSAAPVTTTYNVLTTIASTGCFANDQVDVVVNPIATVNAGLDQTICDGNSAILSGAIGGAATSGTWTGGAGLFSPSSTTLNATYTPSASESIAGTVTLTLTTNDPIGPCGSVSDYILITINHLPTANAGVTQSVCSGSSVTLGGSIGGSATSGTWSGGGGSYFPNANDLNAVYTPSAAEYAAGTFTLLLTTNDPAGPCTFATSDVTYSVFQNPIVNFTVDFPNGCPVHCATFTDLTTIGGGANLVAWDWNFHDGGGDSFVQNPYHCFVNSGYYDITLTATSNQGCVTTVTIPMMIHVFDVPTAEFNPTPISASILDPVVTMNDGSTTPTPAVINFWSWNFGDGDTLLNVSNPIHIYPDQASSSYLATLIVQNSDGCWDTVQHEVFVGPEFGFYIPNAFTPNGDGINDDFNGSGFGIDEYDLWIFDRWGDMIFHTTSTSDNWNGKANAGQHEAQQDVYVWKVELKDVFGKLHNYLGTVTLVK